MTATAKTPGVVGLDVGRASRWIATLGPEPPYRFTRIGQGQSNLTYLVTDCRGSRSVLRRPPLGELAATAHDVAREHRILAALERTDVPTPGVLGLCEDPAVSDAPLLLMEHVDGVVVDTMSRAEALAPETRGRIGTGLIDGLVRLHAVDLRATGLDTLASHAPFAERQLRRWERQWEQVRSRELPAVDELGARLRAALPPPGELTLVHGDYHVQNVVVAPDTGHLRAILDWELCTLGDPIADLGALLAYWWQAADPAPTVFPASALSGFPTRDDLARTYERRSGRTHETLPFWHVLGLWKIAIIAEGVLRRAREHAGNAVPVGTAQAVDDLVARARAVADAAGL